MGDYRGLRRNFLANHHAGFSIIRNLRNAVFGDGAGYRMSFLLPDDCASFLDPPLDFDADVKIEVLPLSLKRE